LNQAAIYTNVLYAGPYSIPSLPVVVCFMEGSLILCSDDIYRPIETLRKGDLIKTEGHGNVAVDLMGRSTWTKSNDMKKTDQLYVYKKEDNSLTQDLIVTGGHSALVDSLEHKQVKDILELLGSIYVTDNKIRLPACLDDRACVFEAETVQLYHICLENENTQHNYGIYANGLLVETCQKDCILEHMDIVDE
jgi:hypothetical protein